MVRFKIPNYQKLSEGYVQGFTIEEMFSKFGVENPIDYKKCSVKHIARQKILQFYIIADAIKDYCTTNTISRSDIKFIKKIVARKTGCSEQSCTFATSSLIDAGFRPQICQLERKQVLHNSMRFRTCRCIK